MTRTNLLPITKNFNKEKLSLDFFHFIRCLKLCEHFYTNPPSASTDEPRTDERSELKWKTKNSDWYPDEVKYNRSEGLLEFIENITKDLKSNLKKNERNFWNNKGRLNWQGNASWSKYGKKLPGGTSNRISELAV